MIKLYPALIHKDPGSDYGVSFPDFPGCISAGETVEEMRKMAQEALQLQIDEMIEDGDQIPAPASLEKAYQECTRTNALAVILVPVRLA